jgi:hypothetical protein
MEQTAATIMEGETAIEAVEAYESRIDNPRLDTLVLAGVLAICAVGCASSANTPSSTDAGGAIDASQGATGADDASPDASNASDASTSADAGGCSGLPDTASAVTEQYSATAPPNATGGSLLDGTYFLTGATLYTGPGGATGATGRTRKATLQLSRNAYLYSSDDDGISYQQAGMVAPSGSALMGTVTCPAGAPAPFTSFSVTSTGFIELAPNYSGTTATFVHTWTKQ